MLVEKKLTRETRTIFEEYSSLRDNPSFETGWDFTNDKNIYSC
jgi:hypothetical protein